MSHTLCIREGNLFCYVFDEDAIILNYLFGYKLKNQQVGFPRNSLEKIVSILEDKSINYKIIGETEIEKNFEKNEYKNILQEAQNKIETNEIMEEINELLDKCNKEKLQKIIKVIKKEIKE